MDKLQLPRFRSTRELVRFQTHELGEYWESFPVFDFDIEITRRKNLFRSEDKVARKLNEIVRKKKVPSQVLIDAWLREKVSMGAA